VEDFESEDWYCECINGTLNGGARGVQAMWVALQTPTVTGRVQCTGNEVLRDMNYIPTLTAHLLMYGMWTNSFCEIWTTAMPNTIHNQLWM
jgi:hypothetical protein